MMLKVSLIKKTFEVLFKERFDERSGGTRKSEKISKNI